VTKIWLKQPKTFYSAGPIPGFQVGPGDEASMKTSTYLLFPGYQQNMLIVM